jgi:predicted DNA binding CopG/RHH family protein
VKISLRLPESDLERLKAKALREGLPYQSLIGSILHKAVS